MQESVGDISLRRARYHNPPPRGVSAGAPTDALRAEFSRRLSAAITRKGIDQSELARRAQERMPMDDKTGKQQKLERSLISAYIRGRSLPGPIRLKAISEVLGVETDDLLPTTMRPSVDRDNPPFAIQQQEDGNVWLKLNRALSMKAALQIMQIIEEEDKGSNGASQ